MKKVDVKLIERCHGAIESHGQLGASIANELLDLVERLQQQIEKSGQEDDRDFLSMLFDSATEKTILRLIQERNRFARVIIAIDERAGALFGPEIPHWVEIVATAHRVLGKDE